MHYLIDTYRNFYIMDFSSHWIFTVLVFAIFFDITIGLGKAWATKTFVSSKARTGVVSHASLLLITLIVYPLLSDLGFAGVADTFLVFLCLSYATSILGNLEALGVPIPDWLKARLKSELKQKEEKS